MTPFERLVEFGRTFEAAAAMLALAGLLLTGAKIYGLDWPWYLVLSPFLAAVVTLLVGMFAVRDRLP